MSIEKHGTGIRTRVLLLTFLALIIAGTTVSSLVLIRIRLGAQLRSNLDQDLQRSVETFQDKEAERVAALERENALMAALPSLKALMTTDDTRTIADGSVEFWKTSGNDLFALADTDDRLLALNVHNGASSDSLKVALQEGLADASHHYLLSDGRLFEYSKRPLYFGSESSGTLLGYVISGFAIDPAFLRAIGRGAGVEVAFLSSKGIAVSSLAPNVEHALNPADVVLIQEPGSIVTLANRERYLITGKELNAGAKLPLRLVVMKSFTQTDRAEGEINRLILLVSLLALGAGSILMLLLARMFTGPLESLATGVRAFGEGNLNYSLPENGTQEVRYLSRVFGEMRNEIQKTHRALLESERLATIGRMASSVSHDLRHYLASVYANAEFLASPNLPNSERTELFQEIQLAVHGTTDMLDSLLIFSRTGAALLRVPTSMMTLVERAVSLVRTHPDAETVAVHLDKLGADTTAAVDTKQMERAIYNLLLNACQSARESVERREVHVSLNVDKDSISVTILDTGLGVADGIRESLFDPFVSQGKQKGTGLGLTLAWSVAREHDGEVKLISSRPGQTIFCLTVGKHEEPSTGSIGTSRSKVLA